MPPREYNFWVYIMSSRSLQFYIGMTNDLCTRVTQHKELRPGTYTARYSITRLVYFEHFTYVLNAIAREKELKKWSRERKLQLIESTNTTMQDLSKDLWPTQFAPELP
ncbi:MAG: GIY-YIG nuclease family protein [Acidobacteriaceae bacterium]